MKREDLKFQIDQLRKDKIIFATEAIAFNMAAFLFLSFAFSFLPVSQTIAYGIAIAILALPLLFTVYMGVSNYLRFRKIKDLEKKLKI